MSKTNARIVQGYTSIRVNGQTVGLCQGIGTPTEILGSELIQEIHNPIPVGVVTGNYQGGKLTIKRIQTWDTNIFKAIGKNVNSVRDLNGYEFTVVETWQSPDKSVRGQNVYRGCQVTGVTYANRDVKGMTIEEGVEITYTHKT